MAEAIQNAAFLAESVSSKPILGLILDNDQIDTHLLYFTIHLLQSSTCFEHYMLIIRRNCIDAASGIVTLSQWPSRRPLTESNGARCCINTIQLPDDDDEHIMLETCRGL